MAKKYKKNDKTFSPSPGAYEMQLHKSVGKSDASAWGFGSQKRADLSRGTLSPGPGAYKVGGLVGHEGKSSSIHAKLDYEKIENKDKNPGPGTYESSLGYKNRAPSYGLGT